MTSPKILVVDDQPVNVQLLKRKLEREGIQVIAAYTGQDALNLVSVEKPDLILLDVMMPDMDGMDVCLRLQEKEDTRSIPVIFITARSSKESKLEGLAVGAVDYITKPIDLDETLARVQTQLRFVAINREMIDLQRRLQESRRAATVGAVTQGIAHNLNNLLGVVLGYLDLIKAHYNKPEFVKKNAEHVETAVQRIVNIIKQLSTLVVKSRPPMLKFSLQRLIDDGVNRYQTDFKIAEPVVINNPLGEQPVETHVEIFEDIVAKLLINAWESYGYKESSQRPIEINTRLVEMAGNTPAVELRIDDRGSGLSPKIRDSMFEPFVSTKETVGVGMGLTVARHALRNLGGEINVIDRPGGGSSAILVHPLVKKIRASMTEPPFP
jgi:two-component system, sensor histidine kinase and response regulator